MRLHAAAAAATLVLFCAGTVDAAEVTLLSSNAVKTAIEELVPQFEKASEHKLKITFGAAANLKAQIEKGEAFDVAILTASGRPARNATRDAPRLSSERNSRARCRTGPRPRIWSLPTNRYGPSALA